MPASTTEKPARALNEPAQRIRAPARAFASTQGLSREELLTAPLRWPRPSLLDTPLEVGAKKMASAMRTLGLGTVGELLEHLPSDSREARTVAALRAGEQATVAVEVRRIGARPVRRRGMRPLVEAAVFDASGSMRATFFNQPWLVERYPRGRACCCTARRTAAEASASHTTLPRRAPLRSRSRAPQRAARSRTTRLPRA